MAASFHIPGWAEVPLGGLGVAGAVGAATGFTSSGIDTVNTVSNSFNLSGWFVRIGEILVGLVLIGIGLNAMLKGKPLQIVTSTAGIAGKAAMV